MTVDKVICSVKIKQTTNDSGQGDSLSNGQQLTVDKVIYSGKIKQTSTDSGQGDIFSNGQQLTVDKVIYSGKIKQTSTDSEQGDIFRQQLTANKVIYSGKIKQRATDSGQGDIFRLNGQQLTANKAIYSGKIKRTATDSGQGDIFRQQLTVDKVIYSGKIKQTATDSGQGEIFRQQLTVDKVIYSGKIKRTATDSGQGDIFRQQLTVDKVIYSGKIKQTATDSGQGDIFRQQLTVDKVIYSVKIKQTTNDSGQGDSLRMVESTDAGGDKKDDIKIKSPPMIYACATMWHENRQEMVQIMKSLYRMDKDQFIRKQALEMAGDDADLSELEYYNFEPHILFDDAFEVDDDDEFVPNQFVLQMFDVLEEAASSVHQRPVIPEPPFKVPTPYGGQLVFPMPGGNLMYLHLKNKSKIRHRKRWSQVMYMYYLLGYRIINSCQEKVMAALESNAFSELISWQERVDQSAGNIGKSQIFQFLDDEVLHK
ncbi:hypothetical protein KUTeg_011364, partial [Tegillarca granosa]